MTVEPLVGKVPENWEYTTLGEACARGGGDIQTGPFGSQLHASDYVQDGIPSIMPQNIGDNRVVPDGIARITKRDAERLNRYRVRPWDIVYSRRGDVERRALIRPSEDGWLCGTGCLRVRFGSSQISPVYASYYLGDSRVREWIVRHAHGATMANLNTSILSELPFVVPPPLEQQAIAKILGTLDDRIDLNRRMNETLEGMARAFFKSWFVDFDPLRAKAEGGPPMPESIAALYPDALEPSAIGDIPEGWHVGRIEDIAEINGLTLSRTDPLAVIDYVEISEVMKGEIGNIIRYERGSEPSRARRRLRHGDTVLSSVRPDRGAYFLALNPPETLIVSTGFAVLTPKNSAWAFLYSLATQQEVGRHLGRLADGGAYPAIRPEVISNIPVALPPTIEPIARFEQLAKPLYERCSRNRQQSHTLAQIRDALLPELVSGELGVPDAERIVGGRSDG